jgi:hypothetical protein
MPPFKLPAFDLKADAFGPAMTDCGNRSAR